VVVVYNMGGREVRDARHCPEGVETIVSREGYTLSFAAIFLGRGASAGLSRAVDHLPRVDSAMHGATLSEVSPTHRSTAVEAAPLSISAPHLPVVRIIVVIVVQEYVVLGLFVLLVIELIVGEIINRMDTGISCNVGLGEIAAAKVGQAIAKWHIGPLDLASLGFKWTSALGTGS